MSPFVPPGLLEVDLEALSDVPVLLQHGTDDPMVPVKSTRALAERAHRRRVPVVFREYPMGHEVALESVQDAQRWLRRWSRGEHPRRAAPGARPEGR